MRRLASKIKKLVASKERQEELQPDIGPDQKSAEPIVYVIPSHTTEPSSDNATDVRSKIEQDVRQFDVDAGQHLTIRIDASISADDAHNPDRNKAALATFTFYDNCNQEVLPVCELSSSPGIGPYVYLNTGVKGASTKVELTAPRGACSMHVTLRSWKKISRFSWMSCLSMLIQRH